MKLPTQRLLRACPSGELAKASVFINLHRVKPLLVVDDDPRLRRQCAAVLRAEGWEVIEARDGRAALALLAETRPALVVCDVTMPGMNGHALLEALRQAPATAGLPFIFLTGNGEMADLRVGMNLGADDYLVKPVEPEELITAVRTRLRRAADAAATGGRKSGPDEPANPAQLLCLGLTPREAEVVFWVAQGKTNPEIAIITAVQLTTIKKHLEAAYLKLMVDNRTAAAALALEKLGPWS